MLLEVHVDVHVTAVLAFLLELRLTVDLVLEGMVVMKVDGLMSKLVPRIKGAGAGVGPGLGEGVGADGDKDCLLLKLTFSEFSVNWIDCLFWLLVRIVKTGGVEGREMGGATDPVPSDPAADFRFVESAVEDCVC